MLGPLPRHPQPTQGQSNGFVADQPRRETLGETDLGGERERPPARGLAKRSRTLMQQRPQGLAGSSIEDGRRGVRARREGLEHRETTMMEGMNDVTYGLIGAAEAASNRSRRLALGTGEESGSGVRMADGDRRPVSSVARSSAVSGRTNKGVCIPRVYHMPKNLYWMCTRIKPGTTQFQEMSQRLAQVIERLERLITLLEAQHVAGAPQRHHSDRPTGDAATPQRRAPALTQRQPPPMTRAGTCSGAPAQRATSMATPI